MIKNIYFCGNPLLSEDNAPYKIIDALRKQFPEITFREFDPTEEFPSEDIVYIIDTVLEIDKVMIIDDINSLEIFPTVSVHDADLAFNLNFLKKLGRLGSFKVIGIPVIEEGASQKKERVLKELSDIIKEHCI
jgi:Ni,Fe-hydrogenase maturation factor